MDKQLISDLTQIIKQKLELFNALYDITITQQKDIETNKADNIEALIQQKQQIIDQVDKLDERFLTGHKKLKVELGLENLEKADTSKYPELKEIKFIVEQIMGMARQIMELENSNREKLDVIFREIKNELRQINVGKKSLKAYEPTPLYNDGIFIDKKK